LHAPGASADRGIDYQYDDSAGEAFTGRDKTKMTGYYSAEGAGKKLLLATPTVRKKFKHDKTIKARVPGGQQKLYLASRIDQVAKESIKHCSECGKRYSIYSYFKDACSRHCAARVKARLKPVGNHYLDTFRLKDDPARVQIKNKLGNRKCPVCGALLVVGQYRCNRHVSGATVPYGAEEYGSVA